MSCYYCDEFLPLGSDYKWQKVYEIKEECDKNHYDPYSSGYKIRWHKTCPAPRCRQCKEELDRYIYSSCDDFVCEYCLDIGFKSKCVSIPWNIHRLLLIGNKDKNSLLSKIPKEMVFEIAQFLKLYWH